MAAAIMQQFKKCVRPHFAHYIHRIHGRACLHVRVDQPGLGAERDRHLSIARPATQLEEALDGEAIQPETCSGAQVTPEEVEGRPEVRGYRWTLARRLQQGEGQGMARG